MTESKEITTSAVDEITAALLVIGDEILSGRTVDKNINTIALRTTDFGIRLREVRVVADDRAAIVGAVNALRAAYDYVFTTGGIGPTHDDITAECVAAAFEVPLLAHPEALALLEAHYPDGQLTDARRLMARVPEGGTLVANSISAAPGFMIGNVIVMAGVPAIVEVMLDDVMGRLRHGRKLHTRSVKVMKPESYVAAILLSLAKDYDTVSIGSYPYFRGGVVGTTVVMRGVEMEEVMAVSAALRAALGEAGCAFEEVESETAG